MFPLTGSSQNSIEFHPLPFNHINLVDLGNGMEELHRSGQGYLVKLLSPRPTNFIVKLGDTLFDYFISPKSHKRNCIEFFNLHYIYHAIFIFLEL